MYKAIATMAVLVGVFLMNVSPASAVELKPSDVAEPKGDGPDGKGNTADDTWGFWFELSHATGTYHRLNLATAAMSPQQRAKGIPRKVWGPIGNYLPNPKDTEGWIYGSDWDGRYEGVWGDKKDNCIIVHPYNEKVFAGSLAITYKAPRDGAYAVTAKVTDLNVVGGDGIRWRVEVADGNKRTKGVSESKPFGDKVGPASAKVDVKNISAKKGQLIRFAIVPNKHWGGDMTRIDSLKIIRAGPSGEKEQPKPDKPAPTEDASKPDKAKPDESGDSGRAVVRLKPSDVADPKGDGPDGKGNTDDDTWGFWFELSHALGTYHRLSLATVTMPAHQRKNGIPRKVYGPIAGYLPNPNDTEGWIFGSDWDGRFEGIWGDKKAGHVIMYPYVEKTSHGAVALTYRVPETGAYTVAGKLTDGQVVKHFRHQGILWRVEIATGGQKGKVVGKGGPIGDKVGPDSAEFSVKKVSVNKGQLIRLVIDPNKWWGTDMTQVNHLRIEREGAAKPAPTDPATTGKNGPKTPEAPPKKPVPVAPARAGKPITVPNHSFEASGRGGKARASIDGLASPEIDRRAPAAEREDNALRGWDLEPTSWMRAGRFNPDDGSYVGTKGVQKAIPGGDGAHAAMLKFTPGSTSDDRSAIHSHSAIVPRIEQGVSYRLTVAIGVPKDKNSIGEKIFSEPKLVMFGMTASLDWREPSTHYAYGQVAGSALTKGAFKDYSVTLSAKDIAANKLADKGLYIFLWARSGGDYRQMVHFDNVRLEKLPPAPHR